MLQTSPLFQIYTKIPIFCKDHIYKFFHSPEASQNLFLLHTCNNASNDERDDLVGKDERVRLMGPYFERASVKESEWVPQTWNLGPGTRVRDPILGPQSALRPHFESLLACNSSQESRRYFRTRKDI